MSYKPKKSLSEVGRELAQLVNKQYSETLKKNLETLLDSEREIVGSDEGFLFLTKVYGYKNENMTRISQAAKNLSGYDPKEVVDSFLKAGITYMIGNNYIGLTSEGKFYVERDINTRLAKNKEISLERDYYGRKLAKMGKTGNKPVEFKFIGHPVFRDRKTGKYISQKDAFKRLYSG